MDPRKISSRKEQRIKQLLTAKEQILNELAQYDQQSITSQSRDDRRNQNKRAPSRQLPRLSSSQKHGRVSTASSTNTSLVLSETAPANLMLGLPSLTNTASLKKRGMVKLPIFRLPTPDANLLALQQQLNETSQQISLSLDSYSSDPTTRSPAKSPKKVAFPPSKADIMRKQFIPCKDPKLVMKTFLLLLQQLTNDERLKICQELYLDITEIDQVINKLKESHSATQHVHSHQATNSTPSPSQELLTTILSPHDTISLFITATYYIQQQQQQLGGSTNRLATAAQTIGNNQSNEFASETNGNLFLPSIEALRVASSEFDFNSIGVSRDLKNFLLLDNLSSKDHQMSSISFSRQSAVPMTRGGMFTASTNPPATALNQSVSSKKYAGSVLERHNSFGTMFAPLVKSASLPSIDKPEGGGGNANTGENSIGKFDYYSQMSSANSSFYLPPPTVQRNRGSTALGTAAGTRGKTRQGTALPPPTSNAGSQVVSNSLFGSANNLKQPTEVSIATANPNELSSELLKSLLTVQKHTNLVKKSLEHAQSFVISGEYQNSKTPKNYHQQHQHQHHHPSSSSSSKAKEVILMLASQKLSKCLSKWILKDLKKGFITWKLFIIQFYRSKQMASFIKVITLRNVLIALQKIVWRVLKKYLSLWQHQVHEINTILRRKRILNAIVKIQSFFRQMLAKEKVRIKRHRKKYELLYEATVKIQSILRGKRLRWKYLKYRKDEKEYAAATLIQKIYRSYAAKKRVYFIRLRKNKHMAAVIIQRIIRGKIKRNLFKRLINERRRRNAIIKIQSLIRGFITRKNIHTLLINRARYEYVVKIQKRMRGYLTRKNILKKIAELQKYKENRLKAAIKLQSTYRMYRNKIYYSIILLQHKLEQNKHNIAATKINRIIRGFLARQLKKQLIQDRIDQWIAQAKQWSEVWSDDTQSYYYYNNYTGESIWEPTKEGYIRNDGRLVLQSGEIIDDPDAVNTTEGEGASGMYGNDGSTSNKPAEKKKTKKQLAKLCNECQDRVAIRLCNECGDQFCTKCYKSTHILGARRHHTYKFLGPKDCNECENVLAIRYCVSCDENFCDGCWRRLHSHGKRIFHPYCEISIEGRVDKRVFTMDGDQLNDGYDAAYAQERLDSNQAQQMSALVSEQEIQQQNQFWEDANSLQQEQQYYYDENGAAVGEGGGSEDYYYDANSSTQQGYDDYGSAVAYDSSITSAAEEWSQYYDENGYAYYYNNYTGQ
eukprot:gene8513-9211_t